MNCVEFEVQLSDYLDNVIAEADRRALELHAGECPLCQELMQDARMAIGFMERVSDVEVPPELVTRIMYHAPNGRLRHPLERRSVLGSAFSRWFQPVLQPRFAMGMAMTILSFAMLGRCTGVTVNKISPADLSPAKVWGDLEDKVLRTRDRTTKYYENLRLVFEVKSRLRELQEQQDQASQDNAGRQGGASKSGTTAPEGGKSK
ncbi:MAG: zf-HC2 domain-containing protein [Bryobacteraceae bacterium]